jgi:hypothetical protein
MCCRLIVDINPSSLSVRMFKREVIEGTVRRRETRGFLFAQEAIMKRHKLLIVTILVIALILSFGLSYGAMWEPYQFEPKDQMYRYQITNYEGGEQQVSEYKLIMDLLDGGQIEISVQTTWMAAEEDLGSEILGGWWAAGAFGLTMAFINPMYAAFFGGLDLHVGNKMSFFGAGVVQVTGTQEVAGRTGFVCELLAEDGGQLQGKYIVDPAVPLPLKTELYDDTGNMQFQTKLLEIDI